MSAPVHDGLFVTFSSPGNRLLGCETGPVQQFPGGADRDGGVKHPADHRAYPGQGPSLVLDPAGRCWAGLQRLGQPSHLGVGQPPQRSRSAFRGQGLFTAGRPGPPPRVRRLRRHLQRCRDLHRSHSVSEHPRRLAADLFPAGSALRTDPTTIAVSHTPSNAACEPSAITRNGDVDFSQTLTSKGQ